jgi:hypothetical protein
MRANKFTNQQKNAILRIGLSIANSKVKSVKFNTHLLPLYREEFPTDQTTSFQSLYQLFNKLKKNSKKNNRTLTEEKSQQVNINKILPTKVRNLYV